MVTHLFGCINKYIACLQKKIDNTFIESTYNEYTENDIFDDKWIIDKSVTGGSNTIIIANIVVNIATKQLNAIFIFLGI